MYNQHEKQADQHREELHNVTQQPSAYYSRLRTALVLVGEELLMARKKFPAFNSSHEGYGVLKEEVDEMWDAINDNDIQAAREEAVQVAAMAVSFILDMEKAA